MGTTSSGLKAIDLAKFIFAILVVGIHTTPLKSYSQFGCFVFEDIIARLAVPFFFMASCYFFFSKLTFENGKIKKSKENISRLKKYFVRIFLLYIIWSAIYLMWQIPEWINTGWFSVGAFIDYFISLVGSGSYYHLWYILSLIYAIPVMYFLLRHINIKRYTVMMLIVYILGVLFYTYGYQYVSGLSLSILEIFSIPMGAVLTTIPSVTLCLFVDKIKIKHSVSLVLFIVCYLFYVVESIFGYISNDKQGRAEYVFMMLPLIFFLFVWLKGCNLKISSQTSTVLRNMSSVIYFIHPMVINLFGLIVAKESMNSVLYFIVISLLSVAIAFALSLANLKFKKAKFLNYLM